MLKHGVLRLTETKKRSEPAKPKVSYISEPSPRYPQKMWIGTETAIILDGVCHAKAVGCTTEIAIEGPDHAIRLSERIFNELLEMTPLSSEEPPHTWMSKDVWSTARQIESLILADGGPSLMNYLSIRDEFGEWQAANKISAEWAFCVLMNIALNYVKRENSDIELRSLARTMHVVVTPEAAAYVPAMGEGDA